MIKHFFIQDQVEQAAPIPEQNMMEVDEIRAPVVPDEAPVPQKKAKTNKTKDVVEETAKDQTVLVENEAEAFALEPLDITGQLIKQGCSTFYLLSTAFR